MSNTKKILLYFSSNAKTEGLVSQMIVVQKLGYEAYFLSNCERGVLHLEMEKHGVKTYSISFPKNKLFYFNHILFLICFVRKHQINFVFSTIQFNNFISVCAQNFTKTKFILFRHHTDYVRLGKSKMAKLFDKFIARFCYKIVAISDKVKEELIVYDKAKPRKVYRINNAYYFNLFPKPNNEIVEELKLKHQLTNEDKVLINIGRMIPLKRQALLNKNNG